MSWRGHVAIAVALAVLVAVSFVARWHVLAESPYPVGVDGFFYPLQVRALLAHGALRYPASPLTFWWMAPFAAATDPIVGAKLAAALGGALIAIPAWGLGARLGRSAAAGLVAAALAAGSAGSAYLSIEFVKQGIGLTVGLAALWLVLRAVERRSRGRIAAAVAGVVAVMLTHKLAAVLVVAIAAPAVALELRARLRGRRLIYAYLTGALAVVVIVVLGLAMPQRFASVADLALLAHLFAAHAQWAAPALATHGFTLAMEHEALIGGVAAVAAAAVLIGRRPRSTVVLSEVGSNAGSYARSNAGSNAGSYELAEGAVGAAFVVLAIALAIPWLDVSDPQGLAFRARVAAFVPLAMCAAIVAGAAASRGAALLARRRAAKPADANTGQPLAASSAPTAARIATGALVAIAAVLSLRAGRERRDGRILAHPALVAAAMAASDQIPSNATVIVPERHIEYMIAWFSQRPVSLRPEAIPYAQRVRLMPLAFMSADLEHAIDAARTEPTVAPPLGVHPRHRNGLVLVDEPTWDWILARLPGPVRRHYARWPTI